MAKALKEALALIPSQDIDWVGLRRVRETTTERGIRDGKPESNDRHTTEGVMVEVLCQGQFGYAATSRLDSESLVQAAKRARENAIKSAPYAVHRFTSAVRPTSRIRHELNGKQALGSLSGGEICDFLTQICEKLKISPKIIRTEAYARTVETETEWVTSNGSDSFQSIDLITCGFQATAQEGNVIQRRSDGGMRNRSFQGGLEYLIQDDLWTRVEQIAEQSLELLSAPECPNISTDLVLKPDQMLLQIHESIGHPLEVDRILGDERNYAGWSFVKPTDFGSLQYGSQLMNVTFDPAVPGEFASYPFDDTGNPARREFLIREGKLLRGLGGIESQARSGIPGVANQRACSWNRPPIDRMANINLEPGTTSWDDLIGSVDQGILMESNRSWSIDDFRNKFQFGCEYARRIQNGKLGEVLRNPNYRGVTVPFWNSLKKVGNSSTAEIYGTPYCGKGEPNQVIRVGHSSPVCLFSQVEVFGGAS